MIIKIVKITSNGINNNGSINDNLVQFYSENV